jgi:hypothetical protein
MFVVTPVVSAQVGPTPPDKPGFLVWDGTLSELTLRTTGVSPWLKASGSFGLK